MIFMCNALRRFSESGKFIGLSFNLNLFASSWFEKYALPMAMVCFLPSAAITLAVPWYCFVPPSESPCCAREIQSMDICVVQNGCNLHGLANEETDIILRFKCMLSQSCRSCVCRVRAPSIASCYEPNRNSAPLNSPRVLIRTGTAHTVIEYCLHQGLSHARNAMRVL